MVIKEKILLIFIFLLAGVIPAIGQSAYSSDDTKKQLPSLTLETIKGEQINLGEMENKMYVILLLSKPSSMTEGKSLMKDVRLWMQTLNTKYKQCVYSWLIVEPLKTSFPFYRIQKGKLKQESFPVVVDKRGKIIKEFGNKKKSELSLIIVEGSVVIMQTNSANFEEQSQKKVITELDELFLKRRDSSECNDSQK